MSNLPPEQMTARVLDEALAEMGREARAEEACSICHASVRPDRRDRHLSWHAALLREIESARLPEVIGGDHRPTERTET